MPESKEILTSNPEILGGERVFAGTRVPVRNLLDYLAAGEPLSEFLEDFPSVSREQAQAALDLARQALTTGAHSP
jgi:uncharacterized protein (DUF433 family)